MKRSLRDLNRFVPGVITLVIVIVCIGVLLAVSFESDKDPRAVIWTSSMDVEVGEPVLFNGSESRDPEGDNLTFEWDLYGGLICSNESFYFCFPAPGNYTVILTVKDTSGNTDRETVHIDVSPRGNGTADR